MRAISDRTNLLFLHMSNDNQKQEICSSSTLTSSASFILSINQQLTCMYETRQTKWGTSRIIPWLFFLRRLKWMLPVWSRQSRQIKNINTDYRYTSNQTRLSPYKLDRSVKFLLAPRQNSISYCLPDNQLSLTVLPTNLDATVNTQFWKAPD